MCDLIEEFSPLTQLHHQIHSARAEEYFPQFDDIRVVNFLNIDKMGENNMKDREKTDIIWITVVFVKG